MHPLRAAVLASLLITASCAASEDEEDGAADAAELAAVSASSSTPVDPCGASGRPTWTAVRDARHALGKFRVDVTGDAFRVHGDDERVLFAPRPGHAVTATRAQLSVRDHQGSFDIDAKDQATCAGARIEQEDAKPGRLLLRGSFADGPAECRALSFTMSMCEPRAGHLAMRVQVSDPRFAAITLETASDEGERIYGLGEQFRHDRLDMKGSRVNVLSQEGGVGRGQQPISAAMNLASRGSAGSEGTTYYAAPHILTSRMRSFFLENTELSTFDMARPEVIEVRTYSPVVQARILLGHSPLELVERFTEYAGRMPPLPEWVDRGAIVALARDTKASLGLVDRMQRAGTPIAAVWNQTWPGKAHTAIGEQVLWNWAYNPRFHPEWRPYVDELARRGIKTLCYVNPMFRPVPAEARPVARDTYAEGLGFDAFVKRPDGGTLMMPVTAFDVALLDVTKPDARSWMKRLIKEEMIDKAGCSGWMADFGEALPFDARLASGAPAASMHNRYPVEWARINREALEENGLVGKVLVWNRSGFTTTPGVSTLVWEGDQLVTWGKEDGMVSALHGLLAGGLSGISLNHSDTGGYTSLSAGGVGYDRERELLQRWTEMNAFTAVLRTHEGNQPTLDAQAYDDEGVAHFARMAKIYAALGFYRRALMAEAQTKGWPLVRHLLLHYPDDAASWTVDDEFLLGREILVAPVKNKCLTWPLCPYDKDVYLPPGRWVHLWSGKAYGSSSAGTHVTVKAPLGQPAVFYREGSPVGARFVSELKKQNLL